MKKIYIMILAAFTLLTLSLNAQVGTPTINYKAVNKSGSRTHNSSVHQAPAQIKASEGEFYVGPYTNDDFSTTGKSLYDVTGAGQVEVSTEIPRSMVEQYIGQEIVGFRFATIGTVSCYSFQIESLSFNDYIDADFERKKVRIMKEYDTFLTLKYGDYMTPPPAKDIKYYPISRIKFPEK